MIFCSWVIRGLRSLCRRAGRGPSSWCEPRPASGASAKTNNDCQIKFELLYKGAKGGDVGHDTFENHAGLQILELFHSLAEARRLESRARITSGLFEFGQDVGDG